MDPKRIAVSAYDFELQTADLRIPSVNDVFDLRNVVLDIDVYEHLDNSFLTGVITINDDNALYSNIKFQGVETLTIGVKLPGPEYRTITKIFYIDKVIKNIRANDQQSVLVLHLVEDIGYISNYINVNQTFTGKGTTLITDIFRDYFGREIRTSSAPASISVDVQSPLKIVAPNITPLQVADWIKERITGPYGEPYYLFSAFPSQAIYLQRFDEMIFFNPVSSQPFVFSQAYNNTHNMTLEQQMYNIDTHHDNNNSEMMKMARQGFVNSKYLFHDVNTKSTYGPGNATITRNGGVVSSTGIGKRWTAYGMFANRDVDNRPEQTALSRIGNIYPVDARLPWQIPDLSRSTNEDPGPSDRIHERPEASILTQVYASRIYDDTSTQAYTEGRNTTDHLLKIDSKAFRTWLTNESLTFSVPGRLFISQPVDIQTTIGALFRLEFSTSVGNTLFRDERRSGQYLVYSARHSFTRNVGYRVYFTGVKLEFRAGGIQTPYN